METNETLIKNFCERNMIMSPYFENYIKNCPSFLLLNINQTNLDCELRTKLSKIHFLLAIQKERNQLFYNEIQSIFENAPIKIVGLKGLFIYTNYYPKENIRIFDDMDTFVKIRNGYKAYKYMKKHDYKLIDYNLKNYNKDIQVILFRRLYVSKLQHLEFTKTINGSECSIKHELHFNFNLNCDVLFPLDEMVERAVCVQKAGLCFYTLEPVDQLLYLMFHTISHLSYVSEIMNELQINLQNLYDVAQLIDCERIDWKVFLERGKKYRLTPFLSLYYHVFNAVIPNKLPQNIFKDLKDCSLDTDFRWKKIYIDVITKKPSEIILGDYDDMPSIMLTYNETQKSLATNKSVSVHDIWHNTVNKYRGNMLN